MSWYDKYYNKIAFNNDFFYVSETGLLYKAASKAIHPRGTNCVRWYEYYFDDDKNKFIRVTDKMRKYRKVKYYSERDAQEFMPEYFI